MGHELKSTSDKKSLNIIQKVDVAFFIQTIIDEFRFPLRDMDIEVSLKVKQECILYIDVVILRVAIVNIIDNAIRFIDPSKDRKWIKIFSTINSSGCAISISDNGIGIDRENKRKIFDIFFKVSENSSSSGLGLYVVHEIISKMQGSITVASQISQGSEFMIWLPPSQT